jgi:hypothetical protein
MSIDPQDLSGSTIQMCPHEDEIPYAQIPNELLRDTSISPNCIWLISFLLSNSSGWVIRIPQVINHVKNFLGKGKVYQILDEAREAGYIKREDFMEGNLKRCKYFVSRTKKFKNFFRRPDRADPERTDPADRDCLEEQGKENQSKSMLLGNGVPAEKEKEENKKQSSLVISDVHAYCIRNRLSWSSEEIEEAFIAYSICKFPVSDGYEYIGGIIRNKRNIASIRRAKEKSRAKLPRPKSKPLPTREEESHPKEQLPARCNPWEYLSKSDPLYKFIAPKELINLDEASLQNVNN